MTKLQYIPAHLLPARSGWDDGELLHPDCVSLTAQYAAVVPHWVVDVACVP
jgi:hypothetical protein